MLMDERLHRYLESEALQLYLFDYEEERMEVYLGKARVPLRALSRGDRVSGENLQQGSEGL